MGWNLIRVKPPGVQSKLTWVPGQGSQEPMGKDQEGTEVEMKKTKFRDL